MKSEPRCISHTQTPRRRGHAAAAVLSSPLNSRTAQATRVSTTTHTQTTVVTLTTIFTPTFHCRCRHHAVLPPQPHPTLQLLRHRAFRFSNDAYTLAVNLSLSLSLSLSRSAHDAFCMQFVCDHGAPDFHYIFQPRGKGRCQTVTDQSLSETSLCNTLHLANFCYVPLELSVVYALTYSQCWPYSTYTLLRKCHKAR
jgi:hypothetical protein